MLDSLDRVPRRVWFDLLISIFRCFCDQYDRRRKTLKIPSNQEIRAGVVKNRAVKRQSHWFSVDKTHFPIEASEAIPLSVFLISSNSNKSTLLEFWAHPDSQQSTFFQSLITDWCCASAFGCNTCVHGIHIETPATTFSQVGSSSFHSNFMLFSLSFQSSFHLSFTVLVCYWCRPYIQS